MTAGDPSYSRVVALVVAAGLLARPVSACADEGPSGPPGSQVQASQVHIQIGQDLQPEQPMHSVAVSSDREGTRLLRVESTGMFAIGPGVDTPRQQVCLAPCTTNLTPSGIYMIRGYGISDSPHFAIGDNTRDLKVHTGSAAVGVLGTTSLTVGVLGVIAGAALVTFAYLQDPGSSERSTFVPAGWGALAGGAALIGLGVVLGVTNTTHIYDGEGVRLAKAHYPQVTLTGLEF